MLINLFSSKTSKQLEIYGDSLNSLLKSCNLKLVDIGSGNEIGPGIGNFVKFAKHINYFPCDPTLTNENLGGKISEFEWKSITNVPEAIWIRSET